MTKTRDLADLGGGFIQAGTGAVQRTVESKLQDVVSVKDFGAVGDGVADDTAAFNAMFATGSKSFQLIPGQQYRIGNVALPAGSNWVVDGNGATIIPKAGATACFAQTYTTQIFNTAIRNLNILGNVIDVIKLTLTGNGVLVDCKISGITATSGTCTTLVTINSSASGQGEGLKVKDITILGASYDYVVYLYGGSSNFGSCEFKNIFHNGGTGVATIYAGDGLFLSLFDLVYHTRGSGIKAPASKEFVHCKFMRMETEAVETGTILYDGAFTNCSFDVSTIYNQLVGSAPYNHTIANGIFKQCFFNNNFVFQTSGTTMTFAVGSTRNTVVDLQIGSADYVRYDAVADSGTFNNFIGEQYVAPMTACTGAITSGATYTLIKNGRVVTLDLDPVSGTSTSLASFTFGAVIPAKYRPTSVDASISAVIIDAGGLPNLPGTVTVDTSGVITVYKSGNRSDTFTGGTTSGLAQSVTMTWIL